MKVYEMTIADIASEIFDKGEDFAEKIFNDIDELEKNKLLEIEQLKQQLAKKDKEIETILKENEELVIKHNVYNWGDKIQKDKVYSLTGEALELLINRQNQKAIEQLEKVKEKLLTELQNVTDLLDLLEYEDYHEFIGCGRGYKNSIEEIDNQIKQLKEMK